MLVYAKRTARLQMAFSEVVYRDDVICFGQRYQCPFGGIGGKPRIKEIKFGSFDNTFQNVVGVGLQEIDDIRRNE